MSRLAASRTLHARAGSGATTLWLESCGIRTPFLAPLAPAGEWDMCRNGRYTEHGIKERHGFGAERFPIEPEFAGKVDPALGIVAVLMEPASIVAKAWDQVEAIGRRSQAWQPRNLLVTGAGPIGLLAALMGMQRKLQVHVFDRNTDGPKPALIRDLGGMHHPDIASLRDLQFDIVMECTAASAVIAEAMGRCAQKPAIQRAQEPAPSA